jgi:hypothetical protein
MLLFEYERGLLNWTSVRWLTVCRLALTAGGEASDLIIASAPQPSRAVDFVQLALMTSLLNLTGWLLRTVTNGTRSRSEARVKTDLLHSCVGCPNLGRAMLCDGVLSSDLQTCHTLATRQSVSRERVPKAVFPFHPLDLPSRRQLSSAGRPSALRATARSSEPDDASRPQLLLTSPSPSLRSPSRKFKVSSEPSVHLSSSTGS